MVPLPSQQALRARTFLTFRPRFFFSVYFSIFRIVSLRPTPSHRLAACRPSNRRGYSVSSSSSRETDESSPRLSNWRVPALQLVPRKENRVLVSIRDFYSRVRITFQISLSSRRQFRLRVRTFESRAPPGWHGGDARGVSCLSRFGNLDFRRISSQATRPLNREVCSGIHGYSWRLCYLLSGLRDPCTLCLYKWPIRFPRFDSIRFEDDRPFSLFSRVQFSPLTVSLSLSLKYTMHLDRVRSRLFRPSLISISNLSPPISLEREFDLHFDFTVRS